MPRLNSVTFQRELEIRGLDQRELARRAGIPETTISAWTRGRALSRESLQKITAVLREAPIVPELERLLLEPEHKNSRPARPRAAVEEGRDGQIPAAPPAA